MTFAHSSQNQVESASHQVPERRDRSKWVTVVNGTPPTHPWATREIMKGQEEHNDVLFLFILPLQMLCMNSPEISCGRSLDELGERLELRGPSPCEQLEDHGFG